MKNNEKSKIKSCRYSRMEYSKTSKDEYEYRCRYNKGEEKTVTKSICKKCKKFSSRYIEYPLIINGIKNKEVNTNGFYEPGTLCKIRLCGDKYKGKTYLGIYLGDLPIEIITTFKNDTKILENSFLSNPGILVPELKKIVYGCESWWSVIESADDSKELTDEDIENTWYVKLLRSMEKGKKVV
ncbi:MAG: hypothetical protein ACI4MA_00465 [Treponema sp.]